MSEAFNSQTVLYAYTIGAFPMGDEHGRIAWFSPDPRAIFEFDGLTISRSLRRSLRSDEFETRFNTRFADVVRACADRPEGTWISRRIFRVYQELHELGHAHSVETWRGDELVGGLYGVAIGGAFFGESMFHRAADASKVALVRLVERLRERGFVLLDTQWMTPHLRSLGAIEIPRGVYMDRLAEALELPCTFD